MGMIAGAKIAWLGLFLAYIIGSIIGIGILLVYRRRNIAVPFGPYLIVGLLLSFLFFDDIIPWYLGFIHI